MDSEKKTDMGGDMAGRPPNGTKEYTVSLEPGQVQRIDDLTGKPKARSKFIREAVEKELRLRGK